MRIVSGTAKSVRLKTPHWDSTRPMTDKVRGAVFNILGDEVKGASVLDLYAGTGAVGIEALSRGAQQATFVDIDKRCFQLIQANLELTKLSAQASLVKANVKTLLMVTETSEKLQLAKGFPGFNLIFFTPPYANFSFELLNRLPALLADDGVVVAEKDRFIANPAFPLPELACWDQRSYGDTEVLFLVKIN